jgi:hypothetical protein
LSEITIIGAAMRTLSREEYQVAKFHCRYEMDHINVEIHNRDLVDKDIICIIVSENRLFADVWYRRSKFMESDKPVRRKTTRITAK